MSNTFKGSEIMARIIDKMIQEAKSQISALQWLLADDHVHGDNQYDVWTESRVALLVEYIEYLELCKSYGDEPMTFAEFMIKKENKHVGQAAQTDDLIDQDITRLKAELRHLLGLIPGETTSMSFAELQAEIDHIRVLISKLIAKKGQNTGYEKSDPMTDYPGGNAHKSEAYNKLVKHVYDTEPDRDMYGTCM